MLRKLFYLFTRQDRPLWLEEHEDRVNDAYEEGYSDGHRDATRVPPVAHVADHEWE